MMIFTKNLFLKIKNVQKIFIRIWTSKKNECTILIAHYHTIMQHVLQNGYIRRFMYEINKINTPYSLSNKKELLDALHYRSIRKFNKNKEHTCQCIITHTKCMRNKLQYFFQTNVSTIYDNVLKIYNDSTKYFLHGISLNNPNITCKFWVNGLHILDIQDCIIFKYPLPLFLINNANFIFYDKDTNKTIGYPATARIEYTLYESYLSTRPNKKQIYYWHPGNERVSIHFYRFHNKELLAPLLNHCAGNNCECKRFSFKGCIWPLVS